MFAVFLLAAVLRVPTPSDLLAYPNDFLPQLAPDGKSVVYVERTADVKANRFRYDVWRVPVPGGAPQRIGDGNNPRVSPDGRHVAYLSRRDGAPQVYADEQRVTNAPDGVQLFDWSPDSQSIAYTTPPAARTAPRGDYHFAGEEDEATGVLLFVQRLGGAAVAATAKPLPIDSFAWSPDGTRIAIGGDDLFVLTVASHTLVQLTTRAGADDGPLWSPDGKQLAYLQQPIDTHLPRLAVIGSGGGDDHIVANDFDESPTPVAWTGDAIYFEGAAGTEEGLYRLETKSQRIERVTTPGVFRDFSLSRDGRMAALVALRSGALPEVAISATAPFAPRTLTHASDALRGMLVSTREVIDWRSPDGTRIEGVLVKPPAFDPSKRYPLLVVLHTGPARVSQPVLESELPYPVELFAARGALVLEPNYRGSSGYGERFRRALIGHLGAPEVADVVSGVDALVARGIVDPARAGAMGWSHGGYIAAMLSTTSDRFAAISAGAGVSDWQTFYTLSDAGAAWASEYHGGTPWDVPEAYRATAPLTYVRGAKTPTLIQHGERDPRAPIAGSYELRRALADVGFPVKMVVYEGAGHAGGSFTLEQFREVMQHNAEWFGCRIWGDATPADGLCDTPRSAASR